MALEPRPLLCTLLLQPPECWHCRVCHHARLFSLWQNPRRRQRVCAGQRGDAEERKAGHPNVAGPRASLKLAAARDTGWGHFPGNPSIERFQQGQGRESWKSGDFRGRLLSVQIRDKTAWTKASRGGKGLFGLYFHTVLHH